MTLILLLVLAAVSGFAVLLLTNELDCVQMSRNYFHIRVSGGGYKRAYSEKRGGYFTLLKCGCSFTFMRILTYFHLLKLRMF